MTNVFLSGLPKTDNGNYLWIQIFYSALNAKGRSGFVMANSAADARASELEIRKAADREASAVDVMVSIGPNFFYTVTLPCTLWFLDKGKKNTDRADKVLFLDARNIFKQVDRAHREFTPQQIEYLANIVRLYRGEETENQYDSAELMADKFQGGYQDIPGLCKVATIKEIEAQGWSLNPGRYVGVAEGEPDDFDFKERLEELNEELEKLNIEAHELEDHSFREHDQAYREYYMTQNGLTQANWRIVKVEDIINPDKASLVSGPFGSNIGKRFFVDNGVPLIRGNNLTLGIKKFIDDGFVYITEEKAHELKNCQALSGDIIFTAAGTLGQVGLIPKISKYPKYVISNKQLRLRNCNKRMALARIPIFLVFLAKDS